MSTLSINVAPQPRTWANSGFARIIAAVSAIVVTYVDVYADALRLADEAQKRYPFGVE